MSAHKTADTKSGFNPASRIFHSLKLPFHLPPPRAPVSVAEYALSLRGNSPWFDAVALIDSASGEKLSFSDFVYHTETLAINLRSGIGLSKGDTALVLSPNLIKVPILYFALLALGVVVSPANPVSTISEISHIIELCKPAITFATSSTAEKLPTLRFRTVLIDSPEFDSLMEKRTVQALPLEVNQSDLAAILYSSGTTGKVKGVMLTHRNLTASASSYYETRSQREKPAVFLYTMPYFHVFGFTYFLKSLVLSETAVIMEKFNFKRMLSAVEKFKVTHLAVTPPLAVAMTKAGATDAYDLSSLEGMNCGGAPLRRDVIEAFNLEFPKVTLIQGYGLTESTGSVVRTVGPEETSRPRTTGRLIGGYEGKIVEPNTGEAMPPGKQGELWLRGPAIMKGYVGDDEATSTTLVEGWLRTGDLCYFDNEGFLYVVDRLKELIKYKGYQVAPAELEQLLHSHPEIEDAAVIP